MELHWTVCQGQEPGQVREDQGSVWGKHTFAIPKIFTWKWASGIQKIPDPDKSMWGLLRESELDEVK